jgi:DNA-binding transcriptional ArsR family regulator
MRGGIAGDVIGRVGSTSIAVIATSPGLIDGSIGLLGMALSVLADPTRRKVFERLRTGSHPVNVLAAGLPVSRPAVSQHLRVLKEAGLVEERSEGVRRIYSLRREGLAELRDWLDSFWGDALEAFQVEAEKSHRQRGSKAE